jgi:GMP reductase
MRIIEEVKLDFKDVLFVPKRSTLTSRREVDLRRHFKFKYSGYEYTGIPIMASNMDGVGTFEMAQALTEHQLFTCVVKSKGFADWVENWDTLSQNTVAVSTGITEADSKRLDIILEHCPDIQFICIDVANGYHEHFGDFVEQVRLKYPAKTIIAGNVVTADMTQELIMRGADIVKVGIGPGSVCTTRFQTGVGYPQLSAIIECSDAAHGLNAHIIADGGCTSPGDVAKAFGAGADFVMLGGMLAGHTEGGGEVVDGRVTFYGMSSDTAMNKHSGGVANYRSSEGKTVTMPYKGDVEQTVLDILGGLRSTCTYIGAVNLKNLSKCTTFVRVTQQTNDIYGRPK